MSWCRAERAEWLWLGTMLATGGRGLSRSRVGVEHFGDVRAQALLRAMRALAEADEQIDVVSVYAWLRRNGVEGLGSFIADVCGEALEVGTVDVLALEAELVGARRRGLIDSHLHGLQVALRDPAADVDRAIAVALGCLRRLRRRAA